MVLELTDSIRGYSCSFLILLSRLICHNSSGFPFLPLATLQTPVQALLPIPREQCSQGSISGRQPLCSFVGNSPHFFSNYHRSADHSQVYILTPDLYPQAADLHRLSISGHRLLDYSSSPYMQTWTHLSKS